MRIYIPLWKIKNEPSKKLRVAILLEWFKWGKSIQYVARLKGGFITKKYLYRNYKVC